MLDSSPFKSRSLGGFFLFPSGKTAKNQDGRAKTVFPSGKTAKNQDGRAKTVFASRKMAKNQDGGKYRPEFLLTLGVKK